MTKLVGGAVEGIFAELEFFTHQPLLSSGCPMDGHIRPAKRINVHFLGKTHHDIDEFNLRRIGSLNSSRAPSF